MGIQARIATEAAWTIRAAIDEMSGAEVAFVCSLDEQGVVQAASPVARGTAQAVPAPMLHLSRGDVVIHNHPSGVLLPSRADVSVAAELSESGVGFYIVNNDVTDLTVVCEPVEPVEIQPIDPNALADILDAGGPLSELFAEFEARESQLEMLKRVAHAFNEDQVLAVEAGTGVGKSYAYLIPALAWVDANQERVVISTATINLQQQLVERDIPMVQRLLGTELSVVLVKGRGNYLCEKRLGELVEEQSLFASSDDPSTESDSWVPDEIDALRAWAQSTETGSRTDLPFVVPDEVWSQVNSDADSCTEVTCRLRENCFFQRARREAAAARVLVANHHLLFVDLALRVAGIGFETRAVLPPFQRIIFDEAHGIENSATSLFSESFSQFSIRKHMRRLRRSGRGQNLGLLARVRQRGADAKRVVEATGLVEKVEEAAVALNQTATSRIEDPTFRFTLSTDRSLVASLLDPVGELRARTMALTDSLAAILEDDDGEEAGPFHDLRVVERRLERLITLFGQFQDYQNHSDRVFWIELRKATDGLRFSRFISSPLDIATVMREAVYDNFETVVFTSATLTVAGSFDYWGGRVGLHGLSRDVLGEQFPSPFPYSECALLAVPTDAPPVQDAGYAPFLHQFLRDVLALTEGHALILFTSYEMLRNAYDATRDHLAELGVVSLKQGDDDRTRLLARFREDLSSVLFATESFWQGVDAPGETLQLVVLCRLPFRVPTDPVLMARTEALEARGGNAFFDLSLPEAVMKFRQGFGRLIRRGTDRGVVAITDNRLVTKRYGSQFLSSLPETRRSVGSASAVLEEIERFLFP